MVGNGYFTDDMRDNHWYIYDKMEDTLPQVTSKVALSFFLLYDYLIPLDLQVVLEIYAFFYSIYFLRDDCNMNLVETRDKKAHAKRIKINSLNLIEDLGEVDYLLTDKTGTLTKNILTLRAVYGNAKESVKPGTVKKTLRKYMQERE